MENNQYEKAEYNSKFGIRRRRNRSAPPPPPPAIPSRWASAVAVRLQLGSAVAVTVCQDTLRLASCQ